LLRMRGHHASSFAVEGLGGRACGLVLAHIAPLVRMDVGGSPIGYRNRDPHT
jgi:hypothetical protein